MYLNGIRILYSIDPQCVEWMYGVHPASDMHQDVSE